MQQDASLLFFLHMQRSLHGRLTCWVSQRPRTLVSAWSGATPVLTRPNGVGNRSC